MQDKKKWWREARLGLFVHWGLYSILGGVWKDVDYKTIGEWIMKFARIPKVEYEVLASDFNPQSFDAEQIVLLAKNAGMKYIVYTTKHHDGFAMYHSKVSKYNIVDATPFKRDPLRELREACDKHDIKLCLYYSHVQDWHEEHALGNDWDFPKNRKRDFESYVDTKALPQLRELLTQYGEIGVVWFDTPYEVDESMCKKFADIVHELQPNCLINGRIGYGLGDYHSTGDNMIPALPAQYDWECPATLNDTWGFKHGDSDWKKPLELVRDFVSVNARGGNYLLNIGPDCNGTIPKESKKIIEEFGAWVIENDDAIRATSSRPAFHYQSRWGEITRKDNKLFLHVFQWPADMELFGLKTTVKRAYLLNTGEDIGFSQNFMPAFGINNRYRITIETQNHKRSNIADVLVLELDGEPEIV